MPAFLLFLLTLLCSPILATNCLARDRLNAPPPSVSDDLNYRGLANALQESCRYYDKAAAQIFELCGQRFSGHELGQAYREIMARLPDETGRDIGIFLAENFTPCSPSALLVTGYYSPTLSASLTPSEAYRFPIYALPPQEHLRGLSRAEINSGSRLTGQEIAYLSDPVDLFFLHVQGSGIIELADGSRRLVSYAGDNGRPYTSIGKILIQEGRLQREEVSLTTIQRYLSAHPEQRQRILNQNERYIFFRLSAPGSGDMVPAGSLGYTLTPGRSVAMDANHYPPGILGILRARRPLFDQNGNIAWQPFSRLVTHQDSGAAIKGPHRLDLYMGSGPEAGQAAGLMKEKGSFTILIPNLSFRKVHSTIGRSEKVALSPKNPGPLAHK